MRHEDWLQRWEENRLRFHLDEVHPLLLRHEDRLMGGVAPQRVLVPLCGKSLDMAWLASRGHHVIGVELAEKALHAFYRENGLEVHIEDDPPFRVFRGAGVTTYAGDLFDLEPRRVGRFRVAYDRAALIALPAGERPRYAAHLLSLLEPGARLLLITLDYDPGEMEGPPYTVSPAEVKLLFGQAAGIRLLEERDGLAGNPHLQEAGLTGLTEAVYLLELRAMFPAAPTRP